ncbi:MAG: hypothetical protein KKD77_22800 [Gammaproteobacteria bacterium]|nr:hypothetical protein [Gammaproteobacteria bacterium]
MRALLVEGENISSGLVEWGDMLWDAMGGAVYYLELPTEDVFYAFLTKSSVSFVGIYAHGSTLGFELLRRIYNTVTGRRRHFVTPAELETVMKQRYNYAGRIKLLLQISCYGDESLADDILVGEYGCSLTYSGTVPGLYAYRFCTDMITRMIAEPDKPIYQIYVDKTKGRRFLSTFRPRFRGSHTMTFNQVKQPYTTKQDIIDAVRNAWADLTNTAALETAFELLADFREQRK